MFEAHSSKRTERAVKAAALLAGILIGCLYASFGRSVGRQWFFSPKPTTTQHPLTTTQEATTQQQKINETERFLVSDDTTIADSLRDAIKVLCWVHSSKYDKERIDAIKKTWGGRCTDLVTIVDSGQNETNVFSIPKQKNQHSNIENIYGFLLDIYGDKFHWFLKTDGNSYVVLENLRFKLFAYDPSMAVGVGLLKNTADGRMYFSDKAGYALSAKALTKLVDGFTSGTNCSQAKPKVSNEERIGICLVEMGVNFGQSTDQDGKQLFFEKNLDDFFLPEINVKLPYPWYQDYKVNQYLDHASNYSITFYGLSWRQMHVMEFLIYQLRPYGIETETPNLPEKILFRKSFVHQFNITSVQ